MPMPFLRRLFAFLRNLIRIRYHLISRRCCCGSRCGSSSGGGRRRRRCTCFFGTSIIHLAFFHGNIPPFTATLVTVLNIVLLVIYPSLVDHSSIGTRVFIVNWSSVRVKFDGKMPFIARPFLSFLIDINYTTFQSLVNKSFATFFNSIM